MSDPLLDDPPESGTDDAPITGLNAWRLQALLPALYQDGFYRRLKLLRRTSPLHRLSETSSRQSWDASRSYDPMLLCVCAIDLVMERDGLADAYDFESLIEAIALVAEIAEPEAPGSELRDVAEWVVRGLLGSDGRADFTADYGDYRGGDYHRGIYNWHLLKELQRTDGRIVLEASVDAINALRSGLDLDVEDAQLAHETVMQAQLERGDLDGAERSADEASRLSVALAVKTRDLMETIRFNMDIVDWRAEFQSKAADALTHVLKRITAEQSLSEYLMDGADLQDSKLRLRSIAILEKVDRCLTRHRELQSLLQDAPKVFLEEQLRQVMPGRTRSRLRLSVFDDLFVPTLSLRVEDATRVATTFALAAMGPDIPRVLDFSELVNRLLRPPRCEPNVVVLGNPFDDIVDQLSDEVDPVLLAAAAGLFAGCYTAPQLLSELLAGAPGPEVAEVLRLVTLLLFDPDDLAAEEGLDMGAISDVLGLVAISSGQTFAAAGYQGDDLLVGPIALLDVPRPDFSDAESHQAQEAKTRRAPT